MTASVGDFPMSFRARPAGRRGISDFLLFEILHFAYAPFRMTVFRNFFSDAKKLPRKVAPCHSEPRPMVECEESPPSYSKRWRLYSRLAGDASLSLSMTYAWGEILRCSTPRNDKQMSFRTYVRNPRLLFQEILRGFTPQNDIIQQRAITTNERFFLPTVVSMTAFLWVTSLCHSERGRQADEESLTFYCLRFFISLRSIQNDNRVIPSAREESLFHLEPATDGVRDPIQYVRLDGDASLSLCMTTPKRKGNKKWGGHRPPHFIGGIDIRFFYYFLITFSTSTVPSLYVVRTKFKPGASSLCTAPLIE